MLIRPDRGANPGAIRALVESSNLKYRDGRRSWIFTCPHCQKAEKLYIRKSDGRFICWYCAEIKNYKGWAEIALRDLTGLPLGTIKESLYGAAGNESQGPWINVDLRDFFSEADEEREEYVQNENLQEVRWPIDYYPVVHPTSRRGLKYLESRGISAELATHYQIRYAPRESRVIFPVIFNGKLYGWQGRYIHATEGVSEDTGQEWKITKILSSDSLSAARNQVVMFADQLVGTDQVILTEGPVDAIKCHDCHREGLSPGNVCAMGKAIDHNQLALIRNAGITKIYSALDPDAAAEVIKLALTFSDLKFYLMKPAPGYKDFGEMSFGGVRDCWLSAEEFKPGMLSLYLDPDVL